MSETELRVKVAAIREALEGHLAERDSAIEATLLAFVAQEHCVLLGPPGTAKSAITEALASCVEGRYVRRLLHKAQAPDELFGGLDLRRFQHEGVVTRVAAGGLCEAEVVFLDETFKGNSLVLNSLLTLLEERQYEDQAGRRELPVRAVFGASNEFPEDESLGALWDRFLVRDMVAYIESDETWTHLLLAKATLDKASQRFVPPCRISLDEWDAVAAEVDAVTIDRAVIDAFRGVKSKLAAEGIVISDRRAVKALRLLKAAAWLDGEPAVTLDHLQALRFALWSTADERIKVLAVLATVERSEAGKLFVEIDGVLRRFRDRRPRDDFRDGGSFTADRATMLGEVDDTGGRVKAALGTTKGLAGEKIKRRLGELRDARQVLVAELSTRFQV
jgi:MoxR-like ATPase